MLRGIMQNGFGELNQTVQQLVWQLALQDGSREQVEDFQSSMPELQIIVPAPE